MLKPTGCNVNEFRNCEVNLVQVRSGRVRSTKARLWRRSRVVRSQV